MDPRHKGRVRKPKEYKAVLLRSDPKMGLIFQEFESVEDAITFQVEHENKYLLITGDIRRIIGSTGMEWI